MDQEHLSTAQLLAFYKEGDTGDVAALEHLASCAECQQSFDDSRWLLVLRRLRGIVEAGAHPSPDELAAYRGHALSSPRIAQIERHLRSCDRCAAGYRRDRVVDQKLAYSSPRRSLMKQVQRQFRPRRLRQLGTVLVRRLGEQLGMLFVPTTPADETVVGSAILERRDSLPKRAHPTSASGRKRRHVRRSQDPVPAAEAALSEDRTELHTAGGGESTPSIRIPADGWELELLLTKGLVFLRLIPSGENVPVAGIRVRIARKDKPSSEVLTDPDGRLRVPLQSGGSRITVHANPPFAFDLVFPTEP